MGRDQRSGRDVKEGSSDLGPINAMRRAYLLMLGLIGALILSSWGPCGGCAEDVDGNADVGFGDLLIVLSEWGPCD